MFGTMTRPVTDFLPRIHATIGSADTDMAIAILMDAVVQFCRESQLIRRVECFTAKDCVNSYLLRNINPDERFSELMAVRVFSDGRLTKFPVEYRLEDTTLYIGSIPRLCNTTFEVEYTLVPRRDSEYVYEVLYEDWLEPIIHLALSKLYLMSDMEWFNMNLSQLHAQKYELALRAARTHIITKHRPLSVRLKPKWGM